MRYVRNSGRKKPERDLQDFTYLNKFTIKQFIKAIKGTGGIKNQIAKRLKCSRPTVNKYIKENEEIRDMWLSEREGALDTIESNLFVMAKNFDLNAIKFFLSTQGKERGYGDSRQFEVKSEVQGTIEHNHQHQIELRPDSNRTDSVLDILDVCGAFNPNTKRLTKDDVEVISSA